MPHPLRNETGAPNARGRVVAALVIVGLVLLTAPLVLIPAVAAIARVLF